LTDIEHAGDRAAQVRMTGVDKQQCTVILAITANGHKLAPVVIFRRKTVPKEKNSARNYCKGSRKRLDI
jgi:hypothetical protein